MKLKIPQHNLEDYLLTEGGIVHHLLVKLHIENQRWILALLLLCLTWLPLVIFTSIDGTLFSGNRLPFLKDYTMQGRLLLAIPIMVLIKHIVYSKIPAVLQYISEVLLLPGDREQFIKGPLQLAKKRSDSVMLEIILLVVVAGIALSQNKGATFVADSSEYVS